MKSAFTTLIAIFLLGAVAGLYFYIPSAQQAIDTYILGTEEIAPPVPLEPEKSIYVLADGTGSTYGTYAIPKVTIEWIEKVLDKTYETSGGRFYLSHIDNDSRNNEVLYTSIPKQHLVPSKPERKNGEISFEYSKRIRDWESNLTSVKKDSAQTALKFKEDKAKFLSQCSDLLTQKVYVNSKSNHWTDIIGILNAAFISLQNGQESTTVKYVVGFSDFIQDAPHIKGIKLAPTPEDVELIAVNPVQNSSNKVTDKLIEYEHPDRVIEHIFNF